MLLSSVTLDPDIHDQVGNAEEVLQDIATHGHYNSDVEPEPPEGEQTPTLESRGDCRYTRDDRYRPDDPDAIVCWECSSKPNNRPNKLSRDDPVGPRCELPQWSRPPAWKLRNQVIEAVDLSEIPENYREVYSNDHHRLLSDIASLRSDDEDSIRRTALRMAYKANLEHVEEYNYHRALALLRDEGVAQELPIIGNGERNGAGGATQEAGES